MGKTPVQKCVWCILDLNSHKTYNTIHIVGKVMHVALKGTSSECGSNSCPTGVVDRCNPNCYCWLEAGQQKKTEIKKQGRRLQNFRLCISCNDGLLWIQQSSLISTKTSISSFTRGEMRQKSSLTFLICETTTWGQNAKKPEAAGKIFPCTFYTGVPNVFCLIPDVQGFLSVLLHHIWTCG